MGISFIAEKKHIAVFCMATFCVATLTACGGGGGSDGGGGGDNGGGGGASVTQYKGSTEPAEVSEENKGVAAETAKEGGLAAIKGEEQRADFPVVPAASMPVASSSTLPKESREWLGGLAEQHARSAKSRAATAAGADLSIDGDCGGHATLTSVDEETTVIKYKEYCVVSDGDGLTISGTVRQRVDRVDPTFFEQTFQNIVIKKGSSVERLSNMTVSCRDSVCSFHSDFVGTDGAVYRVSDVVVDTDASGNYDVETDVCSADLGCITIEAAGLEMCTDGNGFSAGTITIKEATADDFDVQVLFDNGCDNAPTVNILTAAAP